jgi:hypothetical protein
MATAKTPSLKASSLDVLIAIERYSICPRVIDLE